MGANPEKQSLRRDALQDRYKDKWAAKMSKIIKKNQKNSVVDAKHQKPAKHQKLF